MPLVILLAVIALAVMFWRYRTTGLTRNCRWRENRAAGEWRCAFCGAVTRTADGEPPVVCLQGQEQGQERTDA